VHTCHRAWQRSDGREEEEVAVKEEEVEGGGEWGEEWTGAGTARDRD
jgi:hypothetical protein